MEVRIKVRIETRGRRRRVAATSTARRRCGDNGQEDEEKGPIHILCHRSV